MTCSRNHQAGLSCRCHECVAAESIKPVSLYRRQQGYKTLFLDAGKDGAKEGRNKKGKVKDVMSGFWCWS